MRRPSVAGCCSHSISASLIIAPCSSADLGQHGQALMCLSVIFCKASGSLSGTARLRKDNSYYTPVHKALVLVHLLCVKGFVAPVNWRNTGVNNYEAIANSGLLLLQMRAPAHLLLMGCWPISTGQDGSVHWVYKARFW